MPFPGFPSVECFVTVSESAFIWSNAGVYSGVNAKLLNPCKPFSAIFYEKKIKQKRFKPTRTKQFLLIDLVMLGTSVLGLFACNIKYS